MADTSDYTPFPEIGLRALAARYEEVAKSVGEYSPLGRQNLDRAKLCRDACASFDAVQARCLQAELDRDQARHALRQIGQAEADF